MHDPDRHVGYLRQCLAQDKGRLGLFLGAGCPAAIPIEANGDKRPLVPTIAGITAALSSRLAISEHMESFALLENNFRDDGVNDSNVEDWLSQVRALRQVVGAGNVRGLSRDALDGLDADISEGIVELANVELPTPSTPFHNTAAWAGSIDRAHAVQIFTTNYDLLTEQALEDLRVPYFDGFVGSRRSFFDVSAIEDDELPARWVRLWKLHGSINWRIDARGVVSRGMELAEGERRLIHPSHLKYEESRRMPYLAMIDRLRDFLTSRGAALILCGYSFGDQHLNEVVQQGLEGNPTAIAFGLLHGDLERHEGAVRLAQRRANLNLLAKNGAVIGTVRAPWGRSSSLDRPPDTAGITWSKEDLSGATEDGGTPDPAPSGTSLVDHTARVSLGDFAVFGQFLADLIGLAELTERSAHDG